MPISKRLFDLGLLLVTAPVTLVLGLFLFCLILCIDGRPVFYGAKRMKTADKSFTAYKFRTMRNGSDQGVSGGDKQNRISPLGGFLRRTRLDELPQLWNIFRGDMSFVGPRPPDPYYVAQYPEIYGEILQSLPGLTGLATLHIHKFEERVLSVCETREETDAVYRRRCIPRKAHLDRLYLARLKQSGIICFDIRILISSVWKILV